MDHESQVILSVIAENGPLNENQITKLAFRKSHYITRDVVRYRLSSKKNPNNFLELSFVRQREGDLIGNFRKAQKVEKVYSLTMKGFLASLSLTPFEQNYMVKKYKKFLKSRFYPIENFEDLCLQAIKFDIGMFLFDQAINEFVLNRADNMQSKIGFFHSMNSYRFQSTYIYAPVLTQEDAQSMKELQRYYWITGIILMKIIYGDKMSDDLPNNLSAVNDWELFFENIQDHASFDSDIKKYQDEISWESLEVDENTIYKESEEILYKLGITGFSKEHNIHCWGM